MKQELVLVRGLPGSGKSTYCRDKLPKHLCYEPDHLFCDTNGRYRYDLQLWEEAQSFVYKLADYALARKESVVVCDVFLYVSEINEYKELAEHYGVGFYVTECKGEYNNIHRVPKTRIAWMKENWEECNV